MPMFTAARVLSIRHDVRARSTVDRIDGAAAKGVGSPAAIQSILDAHRLILGAVIAQQLVDTEAGVPLSPVSNSSASTRARRPISRTRCRQSTRRSAWSRKGACETARMKSPPQAAAAGGGLINAGLGSFVRKVPARALVSSGAPFAVHAQPPRAPSGGIIVGPPPPVIPLADVIGVVGGIGKIRIGREGIVAPAVSAVSIVTVSAIAPAVVAVSVVVSVSLCRSLCTLYWRYTAHRPWPLRRPYSVPWLPCAVRRRCTSPAGIRGTHRDHAQMRCAVHGHANQTCQRRQDELTPHRTPPV